MATDPEVLYAAIERGMRTDPEKTYTAVIWTADDETGRRVAVRSS